MKKIWLPLLCVLLIHCSKSENSDKEVKYDLMEVVDEDHVASKEEEAPPPPPPIEQPISSVAAPVSGSESDTPDQTVTTISKKIIKNGEMTVQVGDIKKAQTQINDIVKNNKAYIQKEEYHNTDTEDQLNIIVRVPHKSFDPLINSFSNGIGSVVSKKIDSDDVTEEYTNVSIKLANKRIYLEKYRDMLKSAKTTKDMLEIQEKIRELEDEIDVSEGRLRFIDDRVNYSTLVLSIYKEKVRSSETSRIGFGSRFGDSVTEGWNSFVSFVLGIISLWPFFLLIPVLVFLWRKWKKRKIQ